MRVLSLFDGMACGMLAMQDAGITVDRYVAFEIDKYAVQTSSHNFPMIEHRGDVFQADFTEFRGFDFLVGGSPCTYWSIAQKNNRETEASGMGWELFSQYVRALHEAQPMFFIYENNKSMSNAIRESITQTFGFEPICINSALVSAQNRQRLYWVGKRNPDGTYSRVQVDQPEDRGILLRDVLCAESICMRYQRSNEAKKMRKQYEAGEIHHGFRELSELHPRTDGKTNTISTVLKDNPICEPVRVGTWPNEAKNQDMHDSQKYRVYIADGKGVTLCGNGGGLGAKTGLYAVQFDVEELSQEYYHGDSNGNVLGKIVCKNTSNNNGQPAQGTRVYKTDNKSICLDADSRKYIIAPIEVSGWCVGNNGKQVPVYEVKDGQITIKGKTYPIKLADGFYIIRKLTVSECKRLQTVLEWYEFPVSDSQAYKMLGNGWTVLIIANLIKAINLDKEE